MPIFSSGLLIAGALGGLAGDALSYAGGQSANAANEQMNQENITAASDRQIMAQSNNDAMQMVAQQFNAQQVAQQEEFQNQQRLSAQDYNTQMSDTAMQRRMEDVKAAGINPLLAVSQGGASAPTINPMSGAAASIGASSTGAAGQGSSIPMQNTGAAFGNFGGQLNSALQLNTQQANIDLLKAQTAKVNAETGTEIPANANYLKSMTGLTDQNANQAYYNTMKIQEQIYNERLTNDQLRDVLTPISQQNLQVIQGTRDALISAQQSDATAKQLGLSQLRNLNDVQSSQLGKIITYLNAILQPVGTAAKAAGEFH